MKINGTIFSKPQQDQLKRALENGGGGGGGSLTKHVVEMTTANYETIKNDMPKMVGAIVDVSADGVHFYGNTVAANENTIYANAITLGDSILIFFGVEVAPNYVRKNAYSYGPSENDATLVSITDMSSMVQNASFTLTYWTE